MVDEFQDTNRLQLDLLEALERDNLFAVGDEFQSIYRFRHADVQIFRERHALLGEAARARAGRQLPLRRRAAGRRSTPPSRSELGTGFRPLVAGRERAAAAGAELRLFDPDPPSGEPPVELLVTDTRGWEDRAGALGLAALADQPWRRAEARLVAHRLREEISAGRRPGDVVVLVRATASLRLFEQALEDQGLPTYVVGGRGYWSQEQVRDGLAYLGALANPRDEAAFYAVLASPFCGAWQRRARPARRGRPREPAAARGRRCAAARSGRAPDAECRSSDRRWLDALDATNGTGCSRLRASSAPSAAAPSACRSRRCSSGRSSRPATTSRSWPVPAASGGWPTCAS